MNVSPQAHENLARWTVHSNLGKTVFETVQKFMMDPPQILNGPTQNSQPPSPASQGPTKQPIQPPVQPAVQPQPVQPK
jgi:hypothetical protein